MSLARSIASLLSGGGSVVLSSGGTMTGNLTVPSLNGGPLAGMRNRIINGAMMIDQRNAGASVSLTTPTTYVMDRWAFRSNTAITVQRSTTAAIGFINSAYVTVPTGATSASGNFNVMQQSIEGFNVSDLNWGTANAKTVTLSFQVRSTQTGTFAGSIRNGAGDRSYVFTFAIASANTWTSISVTIAGDTTGTWAADNTAGLIATFDLGSGSTFETTAGAWTAGNYSRTSGAVQLTTTSSANLYITGVQLEKGATATPFENRLYGTELALCQRYCQKFVYPQNMPDFWFGRYATNGFNYLSLITEMRAAPTVTYAGTVNLHYDTGNNAGLSMTFGSSTTKNIMTNIAGITAAGFARFDSVGGGSILAVSEL